MTHEHLIATLFDIGAVQFGSFTLKSGVASPIYIDLRRVISYPYLLKEVADAMWEKIRKCQVDCICGVPYTALPIATAISLSRDIPMVMRRKEVKDYGTRQQIEGVFQRGQKCLVVEDLVTSGASIFETIDPLQREGLEVKEAVVLIDREQGGRQRLEERGYRLHAVFTMTLMLHYLQANNNISSETVAEVLDYMHSKV